MTDLKKYFDDKKAAATTQNRADGDEHRAQLERLHKHEHDAAAQLEKARQIANNKADELKGSTVLGIGGARTPVGLSTLTLELSDGHRKVRYEIDANAGRVLIIKSTDNRQRQVVTSTFGVSSLRDINENLIDSVVRAMIDDLFPPTR
jgi:uncharacterized membrane protein YkoI